MMMDLEGENEVIETADEETVDEEVEHDSSGIANADKIREGRVVEQTRKSYQRVFRYITNYFKEKAPIAVIGDELILPIADQHLKMFLGDMGADRSDGTVKAKSTMTMYVSVIKFYYRENGIRMSDHMQTYCEDFMQGYRRGIARKKETGIMKNFEGKVPVSMMIYSGLSRLALFASRDRSVHSSMVHLFMILCWNLFARSVSVKDLRTYHFNWENDCLVIDMSRMKNDQAGEKVTPKHIYANPFNPSLCPILALALHCFPLFRPQNTDREILFVGKAYEVFSRWLNQALKMLPSLGYDIDDFGTHSFRKGIATHCCGFIGGPSVVAIYLRAGWSLGPVQDRYILSSEGGDHLCGRIACGLDFHSGPNFAVLPPKFKDANVLTHQEWLQVIPSYEAYPVGFKACLPYLLASLVYHLPWISAVDEAGRHLNIHENHPIFTSRIYTSGLLVSLSSKLLQPTSVATCPVTGMTATGLPIHIEIARELEASRVEIRLLNKKLEELCENLPARVTQNVLANVRVEGVQSLSRNDFEEMLSRHLQQYNSNHGNQGGTVLSASSLDPTEHMEPGGYKSWDWGGKLRRPVPPTWSFPKGTVRNIVDLFVTGIPAKFIRPFKLIRQKTLARKDQQYFNKASIIYHKLKCEAVKIGLAGSEGACDNLSIHEWSSVFETCFANLISATEIARGRPLLKSGELSFVTFYDYLSH
jgi:hypothetical protein